MAFHQRKDRIRLFISQYGPNGNINVKTDWIQWKANKRIALYPCCVLSSGQPWSRGSKDKPFVVERFVDWDNVSRRKSPNGSSSQLHFVVAKRKKEKEGKKECCHPQRPMLGPAKTGLWFNANLRPPPRPLEHTCTHHTHNLLTPLCSQDRSWRSSQTSTGGSSRTIKRIQSKTSGSPYFLCMCQLLSFHSTFDNAVLTQAQGQSFPLALKC